MNPRTISAASIVLAALAFSGSSAFADDSTAELRAGGLVLQKTDKVALVSEDLYLSPTAVKVSYRFRNVTNADYETVVAFPMPDITGGPDSPIAIPDPASDNFLRFSTRVDGKLVESQAEQRAFLLAPGKPEVEITGRLKSLHIPLVPMQEAAGGALAALRAPERKALIDAGVILDLGEGKGDSQDLVPLWTLRSKFWRNQVFPAGRDVVVEQTYTPGTGSQSTLSFGAPDLSAAERARYRKTYCTDAPFTKAAQNSVPRGERSAPEGAGVRTISLLCHHVRRKLGRPDRNLPPDGQQRRSEDPRLLLWRRRPEDGPLDL